jgi:protein TonB
VQPARAKANLTSYFSDDDYPQDAIRNEQQGTTGFRLDVGPDGRVTNCTITSSSGSSSLDSTTCRLLRSRARFTPATDSSGAKTTDSVSGRIAWRLPAD